MDMERTVINVFLWFLPMLAYAMEKMEIPFFDTFFVFFL